MKIRNVRIVKNYENFRYFLTRREIRRTNKQISIRQSENRMRSVRVVYKTTRRTLIRLQLERLRPVN